MISWKIQAVLDKDYSHNFDPLAPARRRGRIAYGDRD